MSATSASSAGPEQNAGDAPLKTAGFARLYVVVTAAATFLGAFLLFQVQPLIAGAILPWFGGTAAVWTTSLLFFQAALVAGYAYVDVTHRWIAPRHRIVFQFLLAGAALLLLPILPSGDQKPTPGDDPTLPILLLLASCVGLPYFVLSTTGPLLQDWYRTQFPDRSPYRLYALSNFGSLCGLLTYPFLVEPRLDFTRQSQLWSGLFAVYVLALFGCGLASWRGSAPKLTPKPIAEILAKEQSARKREKPPFRWLDVAIWLGLSCGGTLLLLTTTNYLALDVAPDPLLWVVPLALYLLSFIVSFDHPRWFRPAVYALIVLVVTPYACWPPNLARSILPSAAANYAVLFAGCMLLHGELARRRPDPRFLTRYYLWIAVGGALGGLFVAVVAPHIYDRYWEWFGAMLGIWLFAAAALAAVLTRRQLLANIPNKIAYLAGMVCGLVFLVRSFTEHVHEHQLLSVRNVYGVYSIQGLYDRQTQTLVGFSLRSGSTQHGSQVFASGNARTPTTYYSVESGVGTALMRARILNRPLRVGVVGLGAGTLATYGRKDDYYRFYELNPLVLDLAREHFSYLGDCRAKYDVVLGDARLSLEAEDAQDFDLLVLDAFSSDAIPKHLLTREAFQVYLRHLNNEGILAIHVSNRFLNLEPIMARLAEEFFLTPALLQTPEDLRKGVNSSRWVLMTRDPHTAWWNSLQHPGTFRIFAHDAPLWTDAHNSIWPLLKTPEFIPDDGDDD
jgi:SAM-dependent methyltransferase